MAKRVFLVVLDSFGIGEEPDAAAFGDCGSNTLRSIAQSSKFDCPNLTRMGLFNLDGVDVLPAYPSPIGAFGRMQERSMGKDTTIGHWEIAGIESPSPLPTYPNGFPPEVIEEFERKTGRAVLCNKPYSGTQVIQDYGEEHLRTGALIVYTSADSVFQIAAHESVVPVEQLYSYCRMARAMLTGKHGVGRVIARPFEGTCREDFRRTPRRHDFSLVPPGKTMLNYLSEAGCDVIAVGKINDIFAGSGVTQTFPTGGNAEGEQKLLELAQTDFHGLAFVNLVDFDMVYGHRRNIDGYAQAATTFDQTLGKLLPMLRSEDVLIITADHGCDPGYLATTDHTREYVPLLMFGNSIVPGTNLGTLSGFGAVAATVCAYLNVPADVKGENVLPRILK
ncbi:phosphopentomutase [uncultured Ruthenibacterium sp.]|uniref:phosphopentomutase n=1 Tax=uncultured Ruthenibacterium sp. TaxID=1905347 RepID=UPI00349E68E8